MAGVSHSAVLLQAHTSGLCSPISTKVIGYLPSTDVGPQ